MAVSFVDWQARDRLGEQARERLAEPSRATPEAAVPAVRRIARGVRRYGPSPGAVPDARHFAEHLARRWGVPVDATVQVVAELAAEAARGQVEFDVALSRIPRGILVEVRDVQTDPPFADRTGVYAPGGQAIKILRRLASRWGFGFGRSGRVVWAEVLVRKS